MDRLLSALLLLILSPLFLVISVIVKASSPGPVIWTQIRCGLNGRKFVMYKFRSMVADAEEKKKMLTSLNEMDGPVFKIRNDPRITPIGRWLRKTSLDELPQFLNILRGDMSLVGPRPALPEEVEQYERWQRRRLSMKPGLTCLWQIDGRNQVDFEHWMKMDLDYIDNWRLELDFKILLKTVPMIFSCKGM
jgi:lipopolysaccharide/colanic/teichoic acid biosynthesis glycosyltransferase